MIVHRWMTTANKLRMKPILQRSNHWTKYVSSRNQGPKAQGELTPCKYKQQSKRWINDAYKSSFRQRGPTAIGTHSVGQKLRMNSDRIRMKSNPNITFYHILIRIRMRIRSSNPDIFSIWNIKLSRVSIYFVNNFIVDQNHYTTRE